MPQPRAEVCLISSARRKVCPLRIAAPEVRTVPMTVVMMVAMTAQTAAVGRAAMAGTVTVVMATAAMGMVATAVAMTDWRPALSARPAGAAA